MTSCQSYSIGRPLWEVARATNTNSFTTLECNASGTPQINVGHTDTDYGVRSAYTKPSDSTGSQPPTGLIGSTCAFCKSVYSLHTTPRRSRNCSHAPSAQHRPPNLSSTFEPTLVSFPLTVNTSKEMVELEIHEEWWFWHGFWPYIHADEGFIGNPQMVHRPFTRSIVYLRLCDPMDESGFSEEHAFPLLKPSNDVLGVPRRSRKQRGWYQIAHPLQPDRIREITATQPMRSASDLPPELVSRIAGAAGGRSSIGRDRWLGHELSSCAQVCRHWANILQPKLFQRLPIDSHRNMTQLLQIRCTSLTKLTQHGATLELSDKLGNAPFTHLALDVQPELELGVHHSLKISGPLPPRCGTSLRSVHALLPRSLPRSRSLHLFQLTLQDVYFRSFTDLVRLVWELPTLHFIWGLRLTWRTKWPSPVPLLIPELARRPRRFPITAHLEACPPRQHSLTLLLTSPVSASHQLDKLAQCVDEQLVAVRQFRTYFCATFSAWCEWSLRRPPIFGPNHITSPVGHTSCTWCHIDGTSKLELQILHILIDAAEASFTRLVASGVDELHLCLEDCPETWFTSMNWAEFAQIASSSLQLWRIRVQVKEDTPQHAAYMQYAHQHLESLAQNLEIELHVSAPEPSGFLQGLTRVRES